MAISAIIQDYVYVTVQYYYNKTTLSLERIIIIINIKLLCAHIIIITIIIMRARIYANARSRDIPRCHVTYPS